MTVLHRPPVIGWREKHQRTSHTHTPLDFFERLEMHSKHMGVNPKIGETPSKWMVKIMENPIKHGMIWGAHPYFGNTHIFGGLEHVFPASNSNMVVILAINM